MTQKQRDDVRTKRRQNMHHIMTAKPAMQQLNSYMERWCAGWHGAELSPCDGMAAVGTHSLVQNICARFIMCLEDKNGTPVLCMKEHKIVPDAAPRAMLSPLADTILDTIEEINLCAHSYTEDRRDAILHDLVECLQTHLCRLNNACTRKTLVEQFFAKNIHI